MGLSDYSLFARCGLDVDDRKMDKRGPLSQRNWCRIGSDVVLEWQLLICVVLSEPEYVRGFSF